MRKIGRYKRKKQKKWCANKIPVKNTKNTKKLFTFIDEFDSIGS